MLGKTTKNRMKNATGRILGVIFDIANDLGEITLSDRKYPYRALYSLFPDEFKKRDSYRDFYNLQKHGYIRVSHQEGLTSVALTTKARMKIVDKISRGSENDGFYRFVSFDIPEPKRQARNSFRRAIKRMGFLEVQKSLWVCNKNVGDLVELAAEEYKVSDYIVYLTAQRSNVDKLLRKMLAKHKSLRDLLGGL